MKGGKGWPGSGGGDGDGDFRTWTRTCRISALSRGVAFQGTHSIATGQFPTNATRSHGIPMCCR